MASSRAAAKVLTLPTHRRTAASLDRYLAIRSFFTRHAALHACPAAAAAAAAAAARSRAIPTALAAARLAPPPLLSRARARFSSSDPRFAAPRDAASPPAAPSQRSSESPPTPSSSSGTPPPASSPPSAKTPSLASFPSSQSSPSPPHSSRAPHSPATCPNCPPPVPAPSAANPLPVPEPPQLPPGHITEYSPFIRNLIYSSPPLKHATATARPTKEDLLRAANNWWQRLRIRLKWFTIRGWRRFNADDFSAFFSWFVVGNTLWILVGTTTFVSVVFATLNSLSLQEYVARWISDYLTSQAGVTVIFESAIVPKWGTSKLAFKNVYVSRRPQTEQETAGKPSKRKATTAKPPSPIAFLSSELHPADLHAGPASEADNYTMYDINFEEVEVTLSLRRWLDGKGLVKDATVKGVRGVIDRRSVWWDTRNKLNPADFRHPSQAGDFELDSFRIEDFLVTVYQPGGQRPYNVSIFNAKFGPFRKRWLFYDMISAEAMTGQYDNCLFSLHMPQKLGGGPAIAFTSAPARQKDKSKDKDKDKDTKEMDASKIKRMARFRIDGLPIEHAQYAAGSDGPMSWITSGKLDAVLDIKFPVHPDDEVDYLAVIEQIGRNVQTIATGAHPHAPYATSTPTVHEYVHAKNRAASGASAAEAAADSEADAIESRIVDTIAATEASSPSALLPGQSRLARPALRAPDRRPQHEREREREMAARQVTIDIDLRFRDLKAAVPVFTSDLSVAQHALIRPIVAFINANRTLVPIHAKVASPLEAFDGSWTLFEAGLMSSISAQIYDALAYHVTRGDANARRARQVSVWGIQRGAEVLLDTLRGGLGAQAPAP